MAGFADDLVVRDPVRRFRTRRGIEGPFVNSPNAWLRLGWLVAPPAVSSPGVLYDIAGLD